MKALRMLVVLSLVVMVVSALSFAKTDKFGILGGPHDLRYTAGGVIGQGGKDLQAGGAWAAASYTLCNFCHIAHKFSAEAVNAPGELLWNHTLSTATYSAYTSHYNSMPGQTVTTLQNGDTSNPSVLCLSCHDGTVAINANYASTAGTTTPVYIAQATWVQYGATHTGLEFQINPQDLSKTHPINFAYDGTLAAADGTIKVPAVTTGNTPSVDAGGEIRLWNTNQLQNSMQCSTCHEPHSSAHLMFRDFATAAGSRASNPAWSWCLYCHSQTQS